MDSLAHVERIQCNSTFPVYSQAHVRSMEDYRQLYDLSINNPGTFWSKVASDFHWHTPLPSDPESVLCFNFDLNAGPINVEFLKGAKTNISYNLLDRIVNRGYGNRIAYYW